MSAFRFSLDYLQNSNKSACRDINKNICFNVEYISSKNIIPTAIITICYFYFYGRKSMTYVPLIAVSLTLRGTRKTDSLHTSAQNKCSDWPAIIVTMDKLIYIMKKFQLTKYFIYWHNNTLFCDSTTTNIPINILQSSTRSLAEATFNASQLIAAILHSGSVTLFFVSDRTQICPYLFPKVILKISRRWLLKKKSCTWFRIL